MTTTRQIATRAIGFLTGTALLAALTGCVGYVDQPPASGGYYEGQPRPAEVVYVQPPAVQVEASDGSVGVSIRSESDFYGPLTPYGRWEVVGSYGRCWIPGRVDSDWRPYGEGYWQCTDAGWYWVSDEPWAWATYHYGCWDLSPQYGWYWVPQTQWAPSWVSWHTGGGYIGWTPRYPSGVRVSSPRAYVFVEERHFTEPVRRSTVVVNNTTIINQTVINQAPSTTLIERASGRKVQALPVQDLRHKTEAAVVAQQRMSTATSEQRSQPPVRNEAQAAARKAAAEPALSQVEKPTAAVYRPAPPVPKNPEAQPQKPKLVVAPPKSNPAVESAVKPQARPQSNYPAVVKEPTAPNAAKYSQPVARPATKSEKKAPGKPVQAVREKPVASEKDASDAAKQGHNQKAAEYLPLPENNSVNK